MHPKSCPSIVIWKTSILLCPFVYQHKECQHLDGEVPFGLITHDEDEKLRKEVEELRQVKEQLTTERAEEIEALKTV